MKKLIFLFTLSLLLVSMAWGANLVDENIQNWTTRGSYGTYTQAIAAGTVNMTRCIVSPGAAATGVASAGRVQLEASTGILALPSLSSIGTVSLNLAAGGASRTVKLQSGSGSSWSDLTTISGIGTTGATFSFVLNTALATQIRLASPSAAIYVHDIIVTDFVPAGNIPPTINNVTINPSTGITSSTQVTVSATITDSDGTVEAAEVYWGTSTGNRPNFIEMTNTSGSTWTATIPAQANNTTVFYSVYAMDDDADDSESAEFSYTVSDPVPTLTVNPDTRSGFTYVVSQGPSANQTFTVSGSTLSANIVITASSSYQISEDGVTFSSPITLTQSGGTVNATTIYVRLKSGLPIGEYNNETISITSTGASSLTVTCSGEVTAPPPPGYFVDFEGAGETKTAYASGSVSLSGIQWNMTEALIGTDAADFKNGVRSARLRGYGVSAMTMLADVPNGIGTVSFKYRRYGTDSQVNWKVEYSTDQGSNWTQLGSTFTAPASDVVQTFSEALDINDPVRIRIKRATETGSSNNRLNIDDISLSEFIPPYDYPEGTEIDAGEVLIEITGGSGIIVDRPLTPVLNPNFTVVFEQAIELTGDGPWIVTVFSLDEWVACLFDGSWIVEEVDGTGYVYFWLEFAKSKNTVIELKSGNGGNPTLPVELSTFTATISSTHNAVLTWVTETETNVNGFYVYRNMENNLDAALLVSPLLPATNTSSQQVYQFTDKELGQHGTYYYWLMVSDMDGSESIHGPVTVLYEQNGSTSPSIPLFTELQNVYPNPFNPSTTISYALASQQKVSFSIYNSRGQLVRNYQMGDKAAGNHNFVWNGTDENGQTVSTGVYFIRMQAGRDSFSKKAVLMK